MLKNRKRKKVKNKSRTGIRAKLKDMFDSKSRGNSEDKVNQNQELTGRDLSNFASQHCRFLTDERVE